MGIEKAGLMIEPLINRRREQTMKTVIMAGGKGTRIQSIASDIPKPMIPIDGVPVLERELCSFF